MKPTFKELKSNFSIFPSFQDVIRQLREGHRSVLLAGMLRSRFLLIVGPYIPPTIDANFKPDLLDTYAFDLWTLSLDRDKLRLYSAVRLADKWPQLHALMFGDMSTYAFRSPITIQDSTNGYVVMITAFKATDNKLLAFNTDTNKTIELPYSSIMADHFRFNRMK